MAALYDRDVATTATGQRVRDVAGVYELLKTEHTPFLNMAPMGPRPRNSLWEAPVMNPEDGVDNNAVADGQDVVAADQENVEGTKAMLQFRIQKSRRVWGVGDVAQEMVEEYATKDLKAEQMKFKLRQLKEDNERMFLRDGNSRPETGNTAATAQMIRGLAHFIRTSQVTGNSADLPLPASGAVNLLASTATQVTRATAAAVTEDDFRVMMRTIATRLRRGKGNYIVLCTPEMKEAFSNYTRTQTVAAVTEVPLRRFTDSQTTGKITLDVTLYASDFGTLRLMPHFFLPANHHFLLIDLDLVKIRPVRAPRHTLQEYRGGGLSGFFETIYGLEVCNPLAHGRCASAFAT